MLFPIRSCTLTFSIARHSVCAKSTGEYDTLRRVHVSVRKPHSRSLLVPCLRHRQVSRRNPLPTVSKRIGHGTRSRLTTRQDLLIARSCRSQRHVDLEGRWRPAPRILQCPQECDQLLALVLLELQAEFVTLNPIRLGAQRHPPAGYVSLLQPAPVEHFFQARDRPTKSTVSAKLTRAA